MTLQRFSLGVACGVFACVLGAGGSLSAQTQGRKLEVSFHNGNVTILAENVTLREIMAEWSRKGGSRIVNAEKLGGAAIPYLEHKDKPEVEVLRSLLRDVPGYGAAPRIAPAPTASTIEAVFILASRTVPVSGSPASSPVSQPIQQVQQAPPPQPQPVPQPVQGSVDSEIPPVRPVAGEVPPSTPGGTPNANNPNLRPGPGGTVTSTIPGVVIPGAPTPTTPTGPANPPGGRGGRGGGGGR